MVKKVNKKKAKKDEIKICPNCYNKGYSTELKGGDFCMADFIGDKTYQMRASGIRINFCDCGRGKDLQIFFNLKKQFKK